MAIAMSIGDRIRRAMPWEGEEKLEDSYSRLVTIKVIIMMITSIIDFMMRAFVLFELYMQRFLHFEILFSFYNRYKNLKVKKTASLSFFITSSFPYETLLS